MSEMEEMHPDPERDGEEVSSKDSVRRMNAFFRVVMREADEGGMLCVMEDVLHKHQNTPPKKALLLALDRMLDIAEWTRSASRELFDDAISDMPVHYVDPFVESVHRLREGLKEGDPYAAAWAALNASYRFALIAAQWEICLKDEEDRDVSLARFRKDAKTQARYEEIRQECDQFQAKNPRLSRFAVWQAVAGRHEGEQGYSFSSIRRADQSNTNRPKKSKKPKK